jgi:hypothetical protein
MVDQPVYPASDINPVRNSSGALNPATEQRGIISNGVKEFYVSRK